MARAVAWEVPWVVGSAKASVELSEAALVEPLGAQLVGSSAVKWVGRSAKASVVLSEEGSAAKEAKQHRKNRRVHRNKKRRGRTSLKRNWKNFL